ncbi:hypothetical protein Taro_000539 [Colocasia esculenta]|uniref:Uncharacterized protein n=1 Tax=Colocasia esculenta TaxID=4460 RepID=A0A843T869_COLES|nr:hypothetical protein [Colocasia esculenta]
MSHQTDLSGLRGQGLIPIHKQRRDITLQGDRTSGSPSNPSPYPLRIGTSHKKVIQRFLLGATKTAARAQGWQEMGQSVPSGKPPMGNPPGKESLDLGVRMKQLVDSSTLKKDVAEGVDIMVVRELTGDWVPSLLNLKDPLEFSETAFPVPFLSSVPLISHKLMPRATDVLLQQQLFCSARAIAAVVPPAAVAAIFGHSLETSLHTCKRVLHAAVARRSSWSCKMALVSCPSRREMSMSLLKAVGGKMGLRGCRGRGRWRHKSTRGGAWGLGVGAAGSGGVNRLLGAAWVQHWGNGR